MTEEPVPDDWFARPTLDRPAAERVRRRVVAAGRDRRALAAEATLAGVGAAWLLVWAAHAVLPT